MHWLVYDEFPEINATVHVHDKAVMENSPFLFQKKSAIIPKEKDTRTAKRFGVPKLPCNFEDILYRTMKTVAGAGIKTTEREEPYGTPELARQVVDALRPDNRYIIIKNHGCLAVGKTLSEAVKLAMDFHERFAKDEGKN